MAKDKKKDEAVEVKEEIKTNAIGEKFINEPIAPKKQE